MVELGKISAGGSFIQNANGQFEPTGVMEELDMLLEKDTSGVDVLALGEKDIFYDRSSQGLYLRKLEARKKRNNQIFATFPNPDPEDDGLLVGAGAG